MLTTPSAHSSIVPSHTPLLQLNGGENKLLFAHHEQEVKEKVYKGTLLQFGGVSSQCQEILGEFKGPSQGNKNSSTIFLELKGKGPSQTSCTSQQAPEENGGEKA